MYINTNGYYCYRFNDWIPCVLKAVNYDEDFDVRDVFTILDRKTTLECPMFLPADKVKKPERKWRPFRSFEELSETLNKGIGSEIIFRNKKDPLRKITTLIVGYITEDNREDLIQLGVGTLPLSSYFEEIEIWDNVAKQWQPFGATE